MSLEGVYLDIKKLLPEFSDVFCAQEGEDVLVRRLLKEKYNEKGSYVDVGALHPLRFSNTAHYYMRGWNGINIEPNPNAIELFKTLRPRDVNISIAIGERGEATYYSFKEPAYNTFDEGQMEFAKTKTELLNTIYIKKKPLHEILSAHQDILNELIFFNIDVEGMELEVLKTNKWESYRPLLVLVEALDKGKYTEIEQYMTKQDYHFVARTKNTYFFAEQEFKRCYVD